MQPREEEEKPLGKTNSSEYYRSIDKAKRYEVIADSPVSHGNADESDDE